MKKVVILILMFGFLLAIFYFGKQSLKQPKFNPGTIINYPQECLDNRCNLTEKTYDYDYCIYQDVLQKSGIEDAKAIRFFTNVVFITKSYVKKRQDYYFRFDCEYIQGENISYQ